MSKCHIKIDRMGAGIREIVINDDMLVKMNGLPSGRPVCIDDGTDKIAFKPYYRRVIDDEMHVFAVQLELAK